MIESEKFSWIRQPLIQPPGFVQASQISAFSLRGREKTRAQLRQTILLGAAGAMIVGIVLGVMISDRITQPIRALVVETNEIHEGRYGHQLPVRSHDELGKLTEAFNEMSADLKLKELYRDLLDRVTDSRVAEELINGKIELGGELREVTTLFCDIRGFTALTEGMPPREVFDFLNEHMTALTEVVSRYNGVVDKFVGDEIMIVFGAPVSYENDALDAVACALEMIQARSNLNENSLHPLQVGIGIATGPVLAGRMGSQDRQNYTVLGERVNLAARLCGKAQVMEILIDDATRDQLTSEFSVKSLGGIELKGFSRPMETFQVSAELPKSPSTPT
jgi:class 3 adenylate cyclase